MAALAAVGSRGRAKKINQQKKTWSSPALSIRKMDEEKRKKGERQRFLVQMLEQIQNLNGFLVRRLRWRFQSL